MAYNIRQLNELLSFAMENETVENLIRRSISEEELAVAEYKKRAIQCEDVGEMEMAKMFLELADDEKVHSAQLREALKILGLNDEEKEKEGQEEAKEIL